MAYIAQLKQQNSERCYYCWQHIAIMSTCVTALPDDGCQWSKRLFLSAHHLRVHARDDGRLEEAAAQLVPSSTGDHLPTLRHRIFHMLFHLPQDMYTAASKIVSRRTKMQVSQQPRGYFRTRIHDLYIAKIPVQFRFFNEIILVFSEVTAIYIFRFTVSILT